MAPSAHHACLDSLKRGFGYLDERALGSSEVRQYIPEREYKSLVTRFRECVLKFSCLLILFQ